MTNQGEGWVGQLDNEQFSLKESIGGLRGAVESLAPGVAFVVAYVITRELIPTLVIAGGIAVIFTVARLIQRTPVTQAFAGLLGVGIGVAWALLSGQAENYFTWGLITNTGLFAIFLASIVIRRSAVGVILQFVYGLPGGWKSTAQGQRLAQRAMWATWVWVGVFGIRVAAQAPLYFAKAIVALGTVKLVFGLPLFAVGGWLTWVLLRGMVPTRDEKLGQAEESAPKDEA